MKFQALCFLCFCAFSFVVHEQELREALAEQRNRLRCDRLLSMSLRELSEVDTRAI